MQAFLPYIMVYTMKHESPMTLKHWLIWQCAARNDAAAIEAFE